MYLLSNEDGELALKIARLALEEAVAHRKAVYPAIPESFTQDRGVFVTLTEANQLRGCIGFPHPVLPLGDGLIEAATHAALKDPRFYPVDETELSEIKVEVTILTVPKPLICAANERPGQIQTGKHGIIVQYNGYSGLLLPQVAEEYGWDSEEFLNQTCIKAGLPPETWKNETCAILVFEGQIFSEK